MQPEQLIATAILAFQDTSAISADHHAVDLESVPVQNIRQVTTQKQGFLYTNRKMALSAHGPFRNADSPALKRYVADASNMSKVYPGYPQPAFVTFRMHFKM